MNKQMIYNIFLKSKFSKNTLLYMRKINDVQA